MLNVQLEPSEELCDCDSCQRLAHQPLALRIQRSRYHKLMDARAHRDQPQKQRNTTNDDEAEAG